MALEGLEKMEEQEPGAVEASASVDREPGQPELASSEGAATELSLSRRELEKQKKEIKEMTEKFVVRQAQNTEFVRTSELLKKGPAALEEVAEVCIYISLYFKKKPPIEQDSRALNLDGSVMLQQTYLLMVGLPADCVDSLAAAIDVMVDLPASADSVKKLLQQPYFAKSVNYLLHQDPFSIRQRRLEFGERYNQLSDAKEQAEALREEMGNVKKNIAALVGKPEGEILADSYVDGDSLEPLQKTLGFFPGA